MKRIAIKLKEKNTIFIKRLVILLIFTTVTDISFAQSKWVEVEGSSTYILQNTLDILHPKNSGEKKRLIIMATIEAAKNGVKISSDRVLNNSEIVTVAENENLSEDDFIYRAFSDQSIEWQRLETPDFKRDDQDETKWNCKVRGLVRIKASEIVVAPPLNVNAHKLQPNLQNPDVTTIPTMAPPLLDPTTLAGASSDNNAIQSDGASKKVKRKYDVGISVGVSGYFDPTNIEKQLALPSNYFVDNHTNVKVGFMFPSGKNFRVGLTYSANIIKLYKEENNWDIFYDSDYWSNSESNARTDHRRHRNSYTVRHYDEDQKGEKPIILHGAELTFGGMNNFVNPYFGANFNYGKGSRNLMQENTLFSSNIYEYEILMVGGTIGFDFGKGRFKIGTEVNANWAQNAAWLNGEKVASNDLNIDKPIIGGGVSLKFYF